MTTNNKCSLALFIPSASVIATFISPALILIKDHFSLSSKQLGMSISCYLAGYLLGQIGWIFYSKKTNLNTSIKHGIILSIIGSLCLLLSIKVNQYQLFLLGRFIIGFGLSAGLVCGFAIIKETFFESEEKKFLPIIAITFSSSIYLATFFSGCLMYFNSLYLITFIILLYNLVILIIFYSTSFTNVSCSYIRKYDMHNGFHQKSNVIIYSLVLSITTVIAYCYAFYAPLITNELYSLSPSLFGFYNLLNMLAIVIGGMIFTKINKVISEFKICLFALSIIIVSSLPLLTRSFNDSGITLSLFYLTFGLLNTACGLIYPASTFIALEFGNCKATSSAIMNLTKLTLPIIAISISSKIFNTNLKGLSGIIFLFAIIAITSLLISNYIFSRQKSGQLL